MLFRLKGRVVVNKAKKKERKRKNKRRNIKKKKKMERLIGGNNPGKFPLTWFQKKKKIFYVIISLLFTLF